MSADAVLFEQPTKKVEQKRTRQKHNVRNFFKIIILLLDLSITFYVDNDFCGNEAKS